MAALSLAYMSNLFGSLAHYSSGQGAVYYGANYLSLQEIVKIGGLFAGTPLRYPALQMLHLGCLLSCWQHNVWLRAMRTKLMGVVCAVVNLLVWGGIGFPYWKLIGLY